MYKSSVSPVMVSSSRSDFFSLYEKPVIIPRLAWHDGFSQVKLRDLLSATYVDTSFGGSEGATCI